MEYEIIEQLKETLDCDFRELNMSEINSKSELLWEAARVLHLPYHLSENWDLFEEYLTYSEFLEDSVDLIMVIRDAHRLFELGKDSQMFCGIFQYVSEEWIASSDSRSLNVIFVGEYDEHYNDVLKSTGIEIDYVK